MSYRQAANKLNRIRNEKSGTPVRTLSNIVEMEGEKVQEKVDEIIKDILYDNEFSEKGIPNSERIAKGYMPDKRKIRISSKVIAEKIKKYNKDKPENLKIPVNEQENFYENLDSTINISIDDVSVKKQKTERSKDKRKNKDFKTHYVRNTIVDWKNRFSS